MDLEHSGTTPKRPSSKTKATTASTPKAASTRSRKAKATATEPEVVEVTSITAITTPSRDELIGMIATAAYYIAEQRNFEPGHELEDWIEAERQIRTLHT